MLKKFSFNYQTAPVEFIATSQVTKGVDCDVYKFSEDESKDLGIITIAKGCSTPVQKIINGTNTIEGYIEGNGRLYVLTIGGEINFYKLEDTTFNGFSIEIKIGEIMQWQAAKNSDLKVFEICYPPYKDGRFENLEIRNIKELLKKTK